MKSPWKFLSTLTSRPKVPETQSVPAASEQKPVTVAKETLRVQVVIGNTPVAIPTALHDVQLKADIPTTATPDRALENVLSLEPFASVNEVQLETAEDVIELNVDNTSPVEQNDRPPNSPEELRTKPSKNVSRRSGGANTRDAVAIDGQQGVEASSSFEDPASEDATSLDDQIKELRNQLAQKLHQQNDQLKKMLERFDRS